MTLQPPRIHKKPSYRRGLWIADDVRFCFTVFEDNEQTEAGDTTTHTFTKEPWPVCETRWFYFHGTVGGDSSPSTTPFFEKHFKGVDMYVISLGKFGEEEVLHGHVKLKEGAGITIVRDDANNALIITGAAAGTFLTLPDTPASYLGMAGRLVAVNAGDNALEFIRHEGFGNHWLWNDPDGMIEGSLIWRFDEVVFAVSGVNKQGMLYTDPIRSWGLANPHSCQFKITRGATGADAPYGWFAAVVTDEDLHHNLNQQHIGFRAGTDDMIYCTNANGAARTQSATGKSLWPPKWVKWVRSATDIKFYVDGVLKATHNTNLPTQTNSTFFTFQIVGHGAPSRALYMTCPIMGVD